jgi:ketosteroid isomerase-like protein
VAGSGNGRLASPTGEETPVELAQAGFKAWSTGDVEAALQFMHPELVYVTTGIFPGLRSFYSGHAGFREVWKEFMDPWETVDLEIEELVELDSHSLLMEVRFRATGRRDMEVDLPLAVHLIIRDGLLWRFQAYADWAQAVADLGIDDPRGGGEAVR